MLHKKQQRMNGAKRFQIKPERCHARCMSSKSIQRGFPALAHRDGRLEDSAMLLGIFQRIGKRSKILRDVKSEARRVANSSLTNTKI